MESIRNEFKLGSANALVGIINSVYTGGIPWTDSGRMERSSVLACVIARCGLGGYYSTCNQTVPQCLQGHWDRAWETEETSHKLLAASAWLWPLSLWLVFHWHYQPRPNLNIKKAGKCRIAQGYLVGTAWHWSGHSTSLSLSFLNCEMDWTLPAV